MKVKIERINSELQRQITAVISQDVKDPRIHGGLVGVTKVITTPDLKYAKIYLSVYAATKEEKKEVFDTVVRSRVFIRNRLKELMQIRLIPDLTFVVDDSFDYGAKIDKILSTIDIPSETEDEKADK